MTSLSTLLTPLITTQPSSSTAALVPSTSSTTSTPSTRKRIDLVSLKLNLSSSFTSPTQGQTYWASLQDFITGKINRSELEGCLTEILHALTTNEDKDKLRTNHNLLLLGVLYNTTRVREPPSGLRHAGFGKKRKKSVENREPGGAQADYKRIKTIVMGINKKERQELKLLGSTVNGYSPFDLVPSASSGAAGMTKKEAERERERKREIEQLKLKTLGASLESRKGKIGIEGVPIALVEGGRAVQPNLPQDYQRIVSSTSLCSEARFLPDVETLKDRMTLVAYESGLSGGADERAADLGVQAIEAHLKNMIAHVIGLVRKNREKGPRSITKEQFEILDAAKPLPRHPSTSHDQDEGNEQAETEGSKAKDGEPKSSVSTVVPTPKEPQYPIDSIKAVQLLSIASPSSSTASPSDGEDEQGPLNSNDMAALFEINPSVLVSARLAAVERLFALPPDSDESDSSDQSSDDEEAEEEGTRADDEMVVDSTSTQSPTANPTRPPPTFSSKSRPRLAPVHSSSSTASRQSKLSRSGSLVSRHRSSASRTNSTNSISGGKRDQFVIDPSAVAIPLGHPDVAPPRASNLDLIGISTSRNGSSKPSSNGIATPTTASGLSPKSLALRHQLFPELSDEPANSNGGNQAAMEIGAGPASPSNNTSTDGGSESEPDAANTSISDIGGSSGNGGTPGAPAGRRIGPSGQGGQGSQHGRKQLWEVVDSVRLLDGVL